MIIITCGCGKSIAAKPEWVGISIRCAGCGRSHTLNAGVPVVEPPVVLELEASSLKSCPHCSGRIQPAAIKCRHCGRMLREEPIRVTAVPVSSAPETDANGGVGTLMVGLLSWIFFCWVPSPIAWIMGSIYESECRARGVLPSGAGKVGKVLGIIGTLILVLGLGLFTLLLVAAGSA